MNNKTENLLHNLKERNVTEITQTAKNWWQKARIPKLNSKVLLSTLGAAAIIGAGVAYHYTRKS